MGKASPLTNKSSKTANNNSSIVTDLMIIWHLHFLWLAWKIIEILQIIILQKHKDPSRIETKWYILLKQVLIDPLICLFLTGFSVTRDTFSVFSGKNSNSCEEQSTRDGFVLCCHLNICLAVCHLLICQDYDSLDMKQRRCSSPGYIDSPTYSRQGMSPVIPRSPQHYGYTGQ